MKTEYRLANALKSLMSEEVPLDEISVTSLSKRCKVNRQTFYYHFHDIFDLLTLVYLNEKVEGIDSIKSVKEMVEAIFKHYQKNHAFIQATLNSAGRELYHEFITNVCYQTILHLVAEQDTEKMATPAERKAVARFYSAGFAYGIVFYIENSRNKTLNGLLSSFNAVSEDFIAKALKNVEKAGKRK